MFDEPRISTFETIGNGLEIGRGAVLADGRFGVVVSEHFGSTVPADLARRNASGPLYWILLDLNEMALATHAYQITKLTDCESFLDGGFPMTAVDTSDGPFRGRIYVTWAGKSYERCRIFLSTSDDQGQSWSAPTIVDGPSEFYGPESSNSSMANIAVNNQGVVGISWYDRTGIANQVSRNTQFAVSLDGGVTFLPSVKVSSSPADYGSLKSGALPVVTTDRRHSPAQVRVAEFGVQTGVARGGETSGLVADLDGEFHLVWTDNRTGTSQIWTAAVRINRSASSVRPDWIGSWKDVTRDVVVEYSDAKYDATEKTITVQVALSSDSSQLKASDLVLRVTKVSSPFGEVTYLNRSNDFGQQRGVYSFKLGSEREGGRFVSQKQELRFTLGEVPTVSRELATLYSVSLLRLESRIYARTN